MIHFRTISRWKFKEDPDGNAVREFPANMSFSIDDDTVGLLAIAEGAADPIEPLTDAQNHELEIIRAALSGDETLVATLVGVEQQLEDAEKPATRKKR